MEMVFSVPVFSAGRLAGESRAAGFLQEEAERRHGQSRQSLVFEVSGVREERALLEAERARLRALEHRIVVEVENAYADAGAAREQVSVVRKSAVFPWKFSWPCF